MGQDDNPIADRSCTEGDEEVVAVLADIEYEARVRKAIRSFQNIGQKLPLSKPCAVAPGDHSIFLECWKQLIHGRRPRESGRDVALSRQASDRSTIVSVRIGEERPSGPNLRAR
jgi:hypothetical protein